MPTQNDLTHCLDALKSLGAPRVWSLLVSIFGDLTDVAGDHIDGPVLTRLTDGMDIKPEAVRVALHRLRNDDWIVSQKVGRTARHALTASALAQRNAVAPLIYGAPDTLTDKWQVAVLPSTDATQKGHLLEAGFVSVAPRVYVAHDDITPPAGVLRAEGTASATWARAQIIPDDLTRQFDRLLTALLSVQKRARIFSGLSDTEIALLRCLIVHHWRRLVLRHPYLPPSLTGADWPGHLCRQQVVELLAALPKPQLDALAAEDRSAAS